MNQAACFHTTHTRHVDVQQYCIIFDHAQTHLGFLSGARFSDDKAQCAQSLEKTLAESRFVLNDQDVPSLFDHCSPLAVLGKLTKKVVPVCVSLLTQERPECDS